MSKARNNRRRSNPKNSREILSSDIAIIGIACKFPGAADYNQFWQNLSKGVDSIKVIPRTRWDINKYYSTDPRKQNTTLSKWCGLIEGERLFDNRFFNISPREAKNMDPQQRILLEETWHCIEDSAIPMKKLQKKSTSCYVGVMASDYYQEAWASDVIVDSYAGLGNYDCILANRLSYFFGFTGVSMAVDAACASSLVAIHAARQSLMLGESDYAFAAGVNLTTQPWKYISFSKSRMLSPEGKCRTFDKDANGYVPGEGVGIILLQRLEDAIKENNHIYGLIIGSAVNHGGTTKSITAPAVGAQQDVITKALKDAGINPSSISYIEAHGTGTSLGDPVEIESLTKAFREYLPYEVSKKVYDEEIIAQCPEDKIKFIEELFHENTNKKTFYLIDSITEEQKDQLREILEKIGFLETRKNRICKIGSAKTNIGHLEAAAGLAGVIKLVMMLKHREVPPTLNVKTPNPIINFPKTPFEIALKKSAWLPAKEGLPLRAGVSSFGFGGVNSHAIIEEYIPKKKDLENDSESKKLFVLSAKSPKSLNDLISGWKTFSKTEAFKAESLNNICKTLLLGREDLTYRSGTIVTTKEDITRFLAENDISMFNNKNNMWCLRLGNFLWNGSGQCSFLFKPGSLFADKLNTIFDECFDDEEREIMKSEIKSTSWSKSKEMRDLFNLLTGYVFISVLKECGLNYDVISGERNGFILAMVLCNMITLSDAIQILLQRKRWNRIKLNRPTIPFYDHVNKKTIMPFDFNDAYMALMVFEMGRKNKLFGQILVDGIFYTQNNKTLVDEKAHNRETQLGNILIGMGAITEEQLEETLEMQKEAEGDPLGELLVMNKYCKHKELKEALRQQDILRYFVNDVLAHYVKAAQMLFQPGQSTGQKTFENYLEEWNIILKKYGRDIKELLYDKHLFTAKKGRLRREKLLLMIILVSSFRRLNKKWNLTEEILIGEKRFYEIVDLVDDGVIPKESLVELFVSENPKYRDIAEICNSRQQFMKMNRPYTYVRKQNPNIREIIDVNEWVETSISSEDTVPSETLAFNPVQGYTFSQFGELSSRVKCEHIINVATSTTLEESFYESLLYLWLNGASLKWEKLIDEKSFSKAVLPSYPFDRKPFWLERSRDLQKDTEEEISTEAAIETKLIQLDPPYGRQYKRSFSLSDSIVRDHVITELRLIPGAGLIEMGLEAAQKGTRKELKILKEVFIYNPAPVEETLDVFVDIDLHEAQFAVQIKSQLICKGQYETSPLGEPLTIDIGEYINADPVDYSNLYQSLSDIGYQYGVNLQVISKIWEGDNKFFFALDELCQEEGLYTRLSSHLLDGIFQTALAVLYIKQHFVENDVMFIPYFMKKMSLYGDLTDNCYVCINEDDIRHKGDDLFVNFSIYDSSGKMICDIRDMVYKRVSRDFLAPGMHSFAGELHTYTPAWKNQDLHREVRDVSTRLALVFADSAGLYKSLAEELREHYKLVVLVLPGDKYKNGITYVINPDNEEDYNELIRDIAREHENRYNGCDVYHLWCYGDQDTGLKDIQDIYYMNRLGLKSLFSFTRACVTEKIKGHVNVIVCSKNAFVVTDTDSAGRYFHGSIPGFAKSIMLENPKFTIRMIDFGTDGFSDQERAKIIFNEELSLYPDTVTAYRNQTRFVHSLVPEGFLNIQKSIPWKEDGVYIIVGGAGGIGLKLIGHILKKVNATIILVGRSDLTPEKQNKLDRFELAEKEVHYFKGDVTNLNDMKRIVREVKQQYGRILGCIHSGGVLDDKYMMKKNWESFCDVLSPKVIGAWTLHEVTKDEPLDFFLVFSSIVSILGNTGQSDYAAANAFLDSFIQYRAKSGFHGKSISINWTLWSDGGMGNSPDILEAFFKKSGIIDSKQAFKALNNILNNDKSQCVVAGKALVLPKVSPIIPSAAQPQIRPTGSQKAARDNIEKRSNSIRRKITQTLLSLLSSIIDVAKEDLDVSTDLREYGMDSVSFSEFSEKINESLTTSINPTLFFEYPSIKDLSLYLKDNYSFEDDYTEEKSILEINIPAVKETRIIDINTDVAAAGIPGKETISAATQDAKKILLTILAGIIDTETSGLDQSADVREYGLDSVGFTEFAEKINEALNTNVNPTLFFEHPSIDALYSYLVETFPEINTVVSRTQESVTCEVIEPVKTPVAASGVKMQLKQILSNIIDIDPAELDDSADVREYGMDSVGFTEFAERINETLNTNVNPTLFFEHPCVNALNDYLMDTYPDIAAQIPGSKDDTIRKPELYTEMEVTEEPDKSVKPIKKTKENMFSTPPYFEESVKMPVQKENYKGEIIQSGTQKQLHTDIAIVGMSGRFPGADTLDEFWDNLEHKKDSVTEIPKDRWAWEDYWGDPKGNENKTNSKWGGFLRDIRRFDAKFFKISPREAELMDPQQRLLIEEVWHTLEDAGYKPSSLSGTKTGIFVGVCNDDYNELLVKQDVRMDAYSSTGSYFSILPNRISYLLNIHGPSVAIDTACSSALVAIHQAVQSIMLGDCRLAFAGGVNICCTPRRYVSFGHAGMLTKTGKCRSFDKKADGYARGEGIGVIMLKPLEDAVKEGNHIYGVIKATSVNHGGFSTSLTAPNPNAQAQLLIDAYNKAKIDPSTVTYIEAQGTGTSLGDPIEINGLKKAFAELYKMWGKVSTDQAHCGIGTAKTHIGHLESASGIAGVLKVLLSMKHKKLPGILHLEEQNPYINLDGTPFYIVQKTTDWAQLTDENNKPIPRRSGVSAFGFGGANAHVVIEEYIPEARLAHETTDYEYVVCLSAKSPERLFEYAKLLYDQVTQDPTISLGDLAYTLHAGREEYTSRLAIVAKTISELQELLNAYVADKTTGKKVFSGLQNETYEQLTFITKGETGKAFIAAIMKNKEIDKLAQLWVSGFDIEWLQLYAGTRHQLLSLPTYPFAHDHYWIKGKEETGLVTTVKKTKLHRLVDSNESTLQEEKFTTMLQGTEFYLTDHIVGKQKMLPGVAYIEMARAAGELAGEQRVERIQNLVWMRPVIVNGQQKEINISFYPNDRSVDFEVSSKVNADERILHTQGRLIYEGSEVKLLMPSDIDIKSILSRCDREKTDHECYAQFEKAGFTYGRGFQSLKKLFYNNKEGVAFIELPSHIAHTYDEFYLHPSIMDASIQSVLGMIKTSDDEKCQPFLPFSLDELLIYSRLPKKCVAYVEAKKELASNVKIYDIMITDETGKILVSMRNFTLKKFDDNWKAKTFVSKGENDSLSDEQILSLLNKLKVGKVSAEDADKIIGGYYTHS